MTKSFTSTTEYQIGFIDGENKGYNKAIEELIDLLYYKNIDWGSYIKGKGVYLFFDSKSFIDKEIKPRLKLLKTKECFSQKGVKE